LGDIQRGQRLARGSGLGRPRGVAWQTGRSGAEPSGSQDTVSWEGTCGRGDARKGSRRNTVRFCDSAIPVPGRNRRGRDDGGMGGWAGRFLSESTQLWSGHWGAASHASYFSIYLDWIAPCRASQFASICKGRHGSADCPSLCAFIQRKRTPYWTVLVKSRPSISTGLVPLWRRFVHVHWRDGSGV
jgi:hypothetical protein